MRGAARGVAAAVGGVLTTGRGVGVGSTTSGMRTTASRQVSVGVCGMFQ